MLGQQIIFNNKKKKKVSEEPDSSVTTRRHHSPVFHNSCPNQETIIHIPETLQQCCFAFPWGCVSQIKPEE